ncbi:MAG: late competence development ComFB family protein [Pseudomonadota bacterium]
MLTYNSRSYQSDEVEFVHNYYEKLVLQEVMQQSSRVQAGDREFMADVACVALNRLPPRYIRHDVDMTFFMSPQDMQETEQKITNAVAMALTYVESREQDGNAEMPPQSSNNVATTTAKTEVASPEMPSIESQTEPVKNKKSPATKHSEKKPKK